jgi:hypothetical protein
MMRLAGGSAVLSVLILSACSSAPAPPPAAAPPAGKVEKVSLVCGPQARRIVFSQIGVPASEEPVDVAVSGDSIYVLFQPARLLWVRPLPDGRADVKMRLGTLGDTWGAMDLDPRDGSIWVSRPLGLENIDADLSVSRRVDLKKVVGEGAFDRILVAPDALYVLPPVSDDQVWRVDRSGQVLGTAFPVPQDDDSADDSVMDSRLANPVRLERDGQGRVVAWDTAQRKAFLAGADGSWTEAETPFSRLAPDPGSMVAGAGVGGKDEVWYFQSLRRLFYWQGQPVFLGHTANLGTVYFVPKPEGGVRELFEECRTALRAVAVGPQLYAGLDARGVLYGDPASAPALPAAGRP